MLKAFWVGAGGFLGATARYGLAGWLHRSWEVAFPVGTLAVNTLGCFAIGAVMVLVERRGLLSPEARLFLLVGLLGGFTTFSTFGYETIELARARDLALAGLNVAGNLVAGLTAVWLGRAVLLALLGDSV